MTRGEKAEQFAHLHDKADPLVLYNAWDAGSAKTIVEAGAKAIATSSWSVAEAQGYRDGEAVPIDFATKIIARIAASVTVPVTADFEGGYSDDDIELAENVAPLLDCGVIGINFEDRIVKGAGLYDVDRQAQRIAAIADAAKRKGVPLFINARTDLFLRKGGDHSKLVDAAVARAGAYAAAGASSFFVPGLADDGLIGRLAANVALPINIMMMEGVPSIPRLRELGVSRISYGPIPYIRAMAALGADAGKSLS